MRVTFLGTGTSFGVPQIGCDCAVCRSADPRDKRTRSGAILEAGDATILIDTPPELRIQLIAAGLSRVDAVIYTHEHADHINGIDDLLINALWWRSHPTHLSIPEAVQTAQSLGARRTYLTHLTHETGHAALAQQLPEGILPAYDGLSVEVP